MKYRAAVCRELGPPGVLKIEEIEARPLKEGEARIALKSCGVNFPDLLMVAGKYQFKPELPFVPGFESAGDVIEVAPGAKVRVGERVIYRRKTGGFAEQAIATPAEVVRAPEGFSYDEAATFTVGFLTAFHSIVTRGQVKAGERVLITGASGGVGMAAVAICRHIGAEVIAAASTDEKCAATVRAGAAHTINTSTTRIDEAVKAITGGKGVDCVYDPVGIPAEIALRVLSFGGRILIIGFAGDIPTYPANRVLMKCATVIGVRAGEYAKHFPDVRVDEAPKIDALTKIVRPFVSKSYPLEGCVQALEDIAARRAIGRIVLHP